MRIERKKVQQMEDGEDTEDGEGNADIGYSISCAGHCEAGRWTGMWMIGGRRSELIRLLH